jgi:aryl-alcohol dehydrogenase-like predicted oxidoreductase
MNYTKLGKTDLNVSRICFGCWQLSPRWWGEVPLDDWRAAADSALEIGVNFIDTADAYGDGFAESTLGDWMADRKCRDRLVIATKFYWNFEQDQRVPDTSHDYILRECEASLKRLRTDHIDLYQIHSWDPLTRPDEVAAAFEKLCKAGKVRWFGVSNLSAEQMRLYLSHFDVACLQPPYNMIERGVESAELPFCLDKQIGVITYSTLAKGLLTGKYSPDQTFDDARADDPRFRGERFERILGAVQKLQPIADKHGITLPQLAVRWVLTHPSVTSAIVGVKKPEHIETIVQAADDILPARDWHTAAGIIAGTS